MASVTERVVNRLRVVGVDVTVMRDVGVCALVRIWMLRASADVLEVGTVDGTTVVRVDEILG